MPRILAQSDPPLWQRHKKLFAAIAVIIAFSIVGRFRAPIERFVSGSEETVSVRYVVDGDTVVLADGRALRYLGIDTPEMDAAGEHERELAQEARRFNSDLVLGKTVRLEFDSVKKDKYGRTLAYVWIDGKSVNAALVSSGFARAAFYGDNARYYNEYMRLEEDARSKRLGIWAQ
mgnify:CR=1 FL=1